MSSLDTFAMMKDDFENEADKIKAIILDALVKDGLLGENQADNWCKTHTIILRKKSIFRTISDAWKKEHDSQGYLYVVVSLK